MQNSSRTGCSYLRPFVLDDAYSCRFILEEAFFLIVTSDFPTNTIYLTFKFIIVYNELSTLDLLDTRIYDVDLVVNNNALLAIWHCMAWLYIWAILFDSI